MPMLLRLARTAPFCRPQKHILQSSSCCKEALFLVGTNTKTTVGSLLLSDAPPTGSGSSPVRHAYIPFIFYVSWVVQFVNLSRERGNSATCQRSLFPISRLRMLVPATGDFLATRRSSLSSIAADSETSGKGLSAASHKMEVPERPPAITPGGDPPLLSVSSAEDTDPLIQYVVVRQDLGTELKWPLGAIVAQACHAAVDALGTAMKNHQADALRYLGNGSNMRTVVLKVSGQQELLSLRDKLMQHQISHKLWQEEPEKIPTALATVPIRKSAGRAFKGLRLLS